MENTERTTPYLRDVQNRSKLDCDDLVQELDLQVLELGFVLVWVKLGHELVNSRHDDAVFDGIEESNEAEEAE